jgi:hypothetical protein
MLVHWTLTTQQADQVLYALSQRPYAEVNGLISLLVQQANPPLVPAPKDEAPRID